MKTALSLSVIVLLQTGLPAGTICAGEKVRFKTSDGWTIEADYSKPAKGKAVAAMFHGLGSGKNEWKPLKKKLSARGIGYLAVDLRGHGESTAGPRGRRDFRSFTGKEDWRGILNDISAATGFLNKKGIKNGRIIIAGASIGANLALNACAADSSYKGAVLLSPGLDYQGITTDDAIRKTGKLPLFIAASPRDGYSWQSSLALKSIAEKYRAGPGITLLEAPEGHGVNMFEGNANKAAGVLEKTLEWITNLP